MRLSLVVVAICAMLNVCTCFNMTSRSHRNRTRSGNRTLGSGPAQKQRKLDQRVTNLNAGRSVSAQTDGSADIVQHKANQEATDAFAKMSSKCKFARKKDFIVVDPSACMAQRIKCDMSQNQFCTYPQDDNRRTGQKELVFKCNALPCRCLIEMGHPNRCLTGSVPTTTAQGALRTVPIEGLTGSRGSN